MNHDSIGSFWQCQMSQKRPEGIQYFYNHVLHKIPLQKSHQPKHCIFYVVGVVDSAPFRHVSAFLNAKPYAKQIGKTGMQILEVLKIVRNK